MCMFRTNMSSIRLFVCPSISHFAARPLSPFQKCWRLSLFSCFREKKQNLSRVPFRFTTKVCAHWSRRTRRVLVAICAVGNLSNKFFRVAWPMERNSKLINCLPAASSESPLIRADNRSLPSVGVNSDREIECLAGNATVNTSNQLSHSSKRDSWGSLPYRLRPSKLKKRRGMG